MEKMVVMEKMQILHPGKTKKDGFIYLRTLIFSISLLLLIGTIFSIFYSILMKTNNEERHIYAIIEIENEWIINENN